MYRRGVTSGAMMKTTMREIYDADLPSLTNPHVKFIRRHPRGFQSAGIYQSSKTLVSSSFFFSVIAAYPFLSLFRALSLSLSILSLPLAFPKHTFLSPSKMHHTNKTTQAVQRISMPFLSYRRATNEHTVHPFLHPSLFFANHCVLSAEQAPPVSMSLGDVISDCRASNR